MSNDRIASKCLSCFCPTTDLFHDDIASRTVRKFAVICSRGNAHNVTTFGVTLVVVIRYRKYIC